MDKNKLYRKSSMERVSSPEQLNDYIRVSNPAVWILLAAIIALIAGVVVWGVLGKMETTVQAQGVAKNGVIVCYLTEDQLSGIKTEQTVRIDDKEGGVTKVGTSPLSYSDVKTALGGDDYALYAIGIKEGEWRYAVEITAAGVTDGVVAVTIITDSVSPISFILN